MKEKVSVIVPIYNAEASLEKCIQSILSQTYTNIEVILVNDGSTDSSLEICRAFAKRDHRIQIIDQQNAGVSVARNNGIERACGKYIMFVDSDDYISESIIASLVNHIGSNELAVCGITNRIVETNEIENWNIKSGVYHKAQYFSIMQKKKINPVCGGPFSKLFLRDIIEKNHIRFEASESFAEDYCFNVVYLKYVNSVYITDKCLYFRENHVNSLSSGVKDIGMLMRRNKEIIQYLKDSFRDVPNYEAIILEIDVALFFNSVNNACMEQCYRTAKEQLKQTLEIQTKAWMEEIKEKLMNKRYLYLTELLYILKCMNMYYVIYCLFKIKMHFK